MPATSMGWPASKLAKQSVMRARPRAVWLSRRVRTTSRKGRTIHKGDSFGRVKMREAGVLLEKLINDDMIDY